MTASASDTAQVVRSRAAAMESYGLEAAKLEYDTIPAVKTINERSKYAISIATIPHIWRPLIKKLPWYRTKSQAMEAIATLAVTAVARRLTAADIRKDNILSRLLEARDENGERMGKNELSAEAMTLMVAGTDTTSK
jgi:benzoate 4-monooxygenase